MANHITRISTLAAVCGLLLVATAHGQPLDMPGGIGSATVGPPDALPPTDLPEGFQPLPPEAGLGDPMPPWGLPPSGGVSMTPEVVDPELDLMRQQRMLLERDIRTLEREIAGYPIEGGTRDLGYVRLQESLTAVKAELAELSQEIANHEVRAAGDARGGLFGRGRGGPDQRRLAFLLQVRDDLRDKAEDLRTQMANLRSDQAPLAGVIQQQLNTVLRDLAQIEREIGGGASEPVAPPTGLPGDLPPGLAGNPLSPPGTPGLGAATLPPPDADGALYRLQLLQSAARDLRAAGFADLAAKVDVEADRLRRGATPEAPPERLVIESPAEEAEKGETSEMRGELDQMREEMRKLFDELEGLKGRVDGEPEPPVYEAPPE